MLIKYEFRDATHTHFVTLIGKWTIVGGWVKHRADKRDKVTKLKYKSFVMSLKRDDEKTGWVGKKLTVHLLISVTKWVWMASLEYIGTQARLLKTFYFREIDRALLQFSFFPTTPNK